MRENSSKESRRQNFFEAVLNDIQRVRPELSKEPEEQEPIFEWSDSGSPEEEALIMAKYNEHDKRRVTIFKWKGESAARKVLGPVDEFKGVILDENDKAQVKRLFGEKEPPSPEEVREELKNANHEVELLGRKIRKFSMMKKAGISKVVKDLEASVKQNLNIPTEEPSLGPPLSGLPKFIQNGGVSEEIVEAVNEGMLSSKMNLGEVMGK